MIMKRAHSWSDGCLEKRRRLPPAETSQEDVPGLPQGTFQRHAQVKVSLDAKSRFVSFLSCYIWLT